MNYNNNCLEALVTLTNNVRHEQGNHAVHPFIKKSTITPNHTLYSLSRTREATKRYRATFYFFSSLFLLLFYLIYTSPIGMQFSFLITNPLGIRDFLLFASSTLALVSGWLGYTLKAEKEFLKHLFYQTQSTLTKLQKQNQLKYTGVYHRQKRHQSELFFDEAKAELVHLKCVGEGILLEIEASPNHAQKEKERLKQELIIEMESRYRFLLANFRKKLSDF